MLTLALVSVLMTIIVAQAKPLYGEMELYIPPIGNPPAAPEGSWLTWGGTISGDINGNMFFYKTDGRWPSEMNSHFWEIWIITDIQGNMLLMGTDKGVVSWANLKYRMNGVVTNAAPQYTSLIGHRVHMYGDIIEGDEDLDIPWEAPGVFRVN